MVECSSFHNRALFHQIGRVIVFSLANCHKCVVFEAEGDNQYKGIDLKSMFSVTFYRIK